MKSERVIFLPNRILPEGILITQTPKWSLFPLALPSHQQVTLTGYRHCIGLEKFIYMNVYRALSLCFHF
uniref:Uncharacterized protein n=1 Tax=Picea glauca TaxID=3330 RepID=A0A101LWB5_PICGL|nr:hypothetical protein ABT39_MTgene1659 [Picea glauca]